MGSGAGVDEGMTVGVLVGSDSCLSQARRSIVKTTISMVKAIDFICSQLIVKPRRGSVGRELRIPHVTREQRSLTLNCPFSDRISASSQRDQRHWQYRRDQVAGPEVGSWEGSAFGS